MLRASYPDHGGGAPIFRTCSASLCTGVSSLLLQRRPWTGFNFYLCFTHKDAEAQKDEAGMWGQESVAETGEHSGEPDASPGEVGRVLGAARAGGREAFDQRVLKAACLRVFHFPSSNCVIILQSDRRIENVGVAVQVYHVLKTAVRASVRIL